MLALDVSKDTLAVALLDPATRQLCWERQVQNNAPGVDSLLALVAADTPWVMEPTGRYSLSVAARARQAGRQVLMASPRRAKQYLASVSPRAKTDRLDARGLGQYALAHPLPPYPVSTPDQQRLQQLLSARKGLSTSLATLKQRLTELPEAKEYLSGAVADLKARMAALDRQLAKERRTLPVTAELEKVPGIGPVTAAAVALCLTSKRFGHPDQFVAYMGLDIQVRDSGKRTGKRSLSRHGDAELRRLLYMCAQASLRAKESPFKAQYERERAKGLKSTAALCAVARKMARLCWSLERHGSHYDPQRVYRQQKSIDNNP
jgi:transposase